MIIRLSQKLCTRIKAGKLSKMPLDDNMYADWSANVFVVDRIQYVILSNTASLYSCVMYGKQITNDSRFIQRALNSIRQLLEDYGHASIYQKFIAPSTATVSFAKALNRSVIGSMNELIIAATSSILRDETAPGDLGCYLNDWLLSAIAPSTKQRYGQPKVAFTLLSLGKCTELADVNLFDNLPTSVPKELIEILAESQHVRIERIVSHGNASPDGFWYDQDEQEWVIVLKGAAALRFDDECVEMKPGDFVNIPAHMKHRVEWTTPNEPTVWLAVYYRV